MSTTANIKNAFYIHLKMDKNLNLNEALIRDEIIRECLEEFPKQENNSLYEFFLKLCRITDRRIGARAEDFSRIPVHYMNIFKNFYVRRILLDDVVSGYIVEVVCGKDFLRDIANTEGYKGYSSATTISDIMDYLEVITFGNSLTTFYKQYEHMLADVLGASFKLYRDIVDISKLPSHLIKDLYKEITDISQIPGYLVMDLSDNPNIEAYTDNFYTMEDTQPTALNTTNMAMNALSFGSSAQSRPQSVQAQKIYMVIEAYDGELAKRICEYCSHVFYWSTTNIVDEGLSSNSPVYKLMTLVNYILGDRGNVEDILNRTGIQSEFLEHCFVSNLSVGERWMNMYRFYLDVIIDEDYLKQLSGISNNNSYDLVQDLIKQYFNYLLYNMRDYGMPGTGTLTVSPQKTVVYSDEINTLFDVEKSVVDEELLKELSSEARENIRFNSNLYNNPSAEMNTDTRASSVEERLNNLENKMNKIMEILSDIQRNLRRSF